MPSLFHIVILDSSILYAEDKAPAANPEIDQFLDEYSNICTFDIYVPQMAQEEILYQQTNAALKAIREAEDSLRHLSRITARPRRLRASRDVIERQVRGKFTRWLRRINGNILINPISAIDWKSMCSDSVWRRKTFVPEKKKRESEAGFRDAIILHTAIIFIENEKRDVRINFLCGDSQLRSEFNRATQDDDRVSSFTTLSDFGSYIRLEEENLTADFIKEITSRAAEKFFSPGDSTCLSSTENIVEKIKLGFGNIYDNPEGKQSILQFLSRAPGEKPWTQGTSSKYYVGATEFVNKEGDREYHWKTKISQIVLYTPTNQANTFLAMSLASITPMGLAVEFDVHWHTEIRSDHSFRNIRLDTIMLSSKKFRAITDSELDKYRLREQGSGTDS